MTDIVTPLDIAQESMGCVPKVINDAPVCITHDVPLEGETDEYALFGICPETLKLYEVLRSQGLSDSFYARSTQGCSTMYEIPCQGQY